jgi:universal stress protein E
VIREEVIVRESSGLNVLVAVDFSEGSELATERALRLPLGQTGQLILVHVAPPGWQTIGAQDIEEMTTSTVREMTERTEQRARTLGVTSELRGIIRFGNAAREIVAAASELHADLVVVGRHGESALGDLLIGSTAERVVRNSNVPVLVVQTDSSEGYRRLLVASSLDGSELAAFELASRLIDPDVRRIVVLHAVRLPAPNTTIPYADAVPPYDIESFREVETQAAARNMEATLATYKALGFEAEGEIVHSDPRAALLKASREKDIDLLVLGTQQRRRLSRLLAGSVAEAVARHAECDVLVAPPHIEEPDGEGKPAS